MTITVKNEVHEPCIRWEDTIPGQLYYNKAHPELVVVSCQIFEGKHVNAVALTDCSPLCVESGRQWNPTAKSEWVLAKGTLTVKGYDE